MGIECYDQNRNALTYQGNDVVICHPPCDHWASLKLFTKKPIAEKYLALHALWLVECNGGILEHPAQSKLWHLVKSNPTHYTGRLLSIDLKWFGFPAKKRTTIYIKGARLKDLPPHPITFTRETHFIGNRGKGSRKELSKRLRNETPREMCLWLIEVAKEIQSNRLATGWRPAGDRHNQ